MDSVKTQLAERDQVIGELTVANRVLKVGQLKMGETLKWMMQGELLADRDIRLIRVLGTLGISRLSWYRVHERKESVLDEWWSRLMNHWPVAFQRLPGVTRDGGINASRWCVENPGWRFRIVWSIRL